MAGKRFDLSVVIRGIDNISGVIGRVQRSVAGFHNRVVTRMRGFGQRMGFGEMQRAAGGFRTALGGLLGPLTAVGGAVAVLGATAAATAFNMVQAFADVAGGVNDAANSIGINAESLQEWRYAAKQNGVEAEELDKSLQVLTRNLGQAAKGKGPADLLKALGIGLRATTGELKTAEQIVPEFADKMMAIRDPAIRAAAAQELLGRAGIKLLPMLTDGRAGLAAYAAEARRLNLVISNESVAATDDFGDKMDKLMVAFTGLRNVAGAALMPVLKKLVDTLTEFVSSHGDKVRGFFEQLAGRLEQLPDHITTLNEKWDEFKEKVKPLTDFVGALCDRFGTANVILAVLASVIGTVVITAVAQLVVAVYALGVAIASTPLGWILVVFAAIVAGIALLIANWDFLKKAFETWWQSVKAVFGAFRDFLAGIWEDIKNGFKSGFLDGIIALWTTLNPVSLIIRAFKSLFPAIKQAVAPLMQWASDTFGGLLPDWAHKLIDGVGGRAAGAGEGKATGKGKVGGRAGGAGGGEAPAKGTALGPPVGAQALGQRAAAVRDSRAHVQVDFNRMPVGTRVQSTAQGPMTFGLNQGYARSY